LNFSDPKDADRCIEFSEKSLQDILTADTDLVVMSSLAGSSASYYTGSAELNPAVFADAFESVIAELVRHGISILVIQDNPRPAPPMDIPQCVRRHQQNLLYCSGPRTAWIHPDPLAAAANRFDSSAVTVVGFAEGSCDEARCYGVVGGVITLFDKTHMTASFAKTLAPYLEVPIASALRQREP
jgi:hypothetical protein